MVYRVVIKSSVIYILCIYKAFKNIWMIVQYILDYFCRNKQKDYAALKCYYSQKSTVSFDYYTLTLSPPKTIFVCWIRMP